MKQRELSISILKEEIHEKSLLLNEREQMSLLDTLLTDRLAESDAKVASLHEETNRLSKELGKSVLQVSLLQSEVDGK